MQRCIFQSDIPEQTCHFRRQPWAADSYRQLIDSHVELLALILMFLRQLDHHAAGGDVIKELLELVDLVTNVLFQSI